MASVVPIELRTDDCFGPDAQGSSMLNAWQEEAHACEGCSMLYNARSGYFVVEKRRKTRLAPRF
jgi:hypothetical protein